MKNILLILCLIFSLSASAQFGGSAWGGSASRAALAAVEEKTGAKDHDASKSYKEGDLVWYNSALYRCKADIIAKAWDVADWDEITGTSEEFWQRIGTVISTLNPNDSVGIGIADAKTNLHVLTSGTSGLASIVEGRGVVITGIGGQSRLYFESPSSNTGERVSMLNFQDGKLSVSSLGDNGGSFVNVDIFTVKYDGNVGVNIADPATSLHVKHNSSGRDFSSIFSHVGQVIEGSESAVLSLTSSNTGTSEIWFDDSDSTVGGTSGRIRYEHAINAMKLLVNNGTVVTMLANGKVGIGDINPTEKLVVKANQGRIRVDTDTADTAPGFELAEVGVRKWISYNAADDSFRIKGLGNDVITVTQSENVGVGKVDPIFKLEVQTVAGGDPISWRNPTYKLGELSWGAGNDAGWIGLYNDGNRVVEIDANGFSYLDGPGAEFAIGENNPEGLLEVSASGSTAKDLFLLSSDDGTDGDLFIVKGTGEVGIGTNAPGAGTKLHVKSSTLATIVKIENASTTGETAWQLQNDSLGAFATLYGSVYPTASLRNNLVYVGEDGVTLDFLTEGNYPIQFFTGVNVITGTPSLKIAIDDWLETRKGRVAINATDGKQIFVPSDLDEFESGGIYTMPAGQYWFMADMTITGRFVGPVGGDVIFQGASPNIAITMSNTGTLFTSNGGLDFRFIHLEVNATGVGAEFMDLTHTTFFTDRLQVNFGAANQSIGSVTTSSSCQVTNSFFLGFTDGLRLPSSGILSWNSLFMQSTFATANTFVDVGAVTVRSDINAMVMAAGPGESLWNIDPTVPFMNIDNVNDIAGVGANFFKPGTVGDVTLFADSSDSGSVTTVADNGSGFARFTTSVVHGMSTGQTVTNTGFSDSNYNTTAVIVVISTTEYDIVSVPFGATDTGSFASNAVTVTSTGHGQSNSQTLKIRETLNYDGGYAIFDALTNTFQINSVFYTAETSGKFDTGSLTQVDPGIIVINCGTQADSAVSAEVKLDNNTLATDIPAVDALVIIASTPDFTHITEERMFVTDQGESIYRGINPSSLKLDGNITMEPATATKNLEASFFRQDTVRNTVTFTNGTNLINETGTALSDGDHITFNSNMGTLPAELRDDIIYYVISKLTNSFQVSYTSGGAAITFTDDGSGTNTYATGELHGAAPTLALTAANPGTVVPQALAITDTDDILYPVVSNKDDAVNIVVGKVYYRVFK